MFLGLVILAVLIGTLMPVQAALNAELTRIIKSPFLGAFISFTTGAIALSLISFFTGGFTEIKRVTEAPPHLFLGGILGAIFVGSTIFFIPRMGATVMIGTFVTGQLLGSLVIDHFGLLGLNPNPITTTRVLGVFLLFVGLLLVLKKNA